MARLPLTALAATLLTLLLSTTATAAPTGTIAGRDNGDGSWSFMAEVAWDGCPEVCDWRINVDTVPRGDGSRCSRDGQPRDPASGGHGTPGAFGRRAPYGTNGTQRDGVAGISRALPERADTYFTLCLAAVGLTPPRPAGLTQEQQVQWALDHADCPDPTAVYPELGLNAERRCLRFYPLGSARIDVRGVPQPPHDPFGVLTSKPTRAAGTATGRVSLSRSEAFKALRRKKVRGAISCKKLSATKQRCKVSAKKRKRTYVVTETTKGIRVKRT